MPEPYNYLTNLPNPGQQMLAGLQSGMGMAQSAQQMRLAQEQADQMAMLRGAQMEQEQAQTAKIKYEMGLSQERERAVADYFKRPAHERTVEAMEPILAMMPKDRADAMRAANEAKTKEQRTADVKSGVQALSAVMSGDREAYERIIGSQMAAAENAGDSTRAQALASALKLSPEAIELTIKANLASLGAEGKQALDNLNEVQKAQFEAQLQPEKLRKLKGEAQQEEVKGQYQEKTIKSQIKRDEASAAASYASAGKAYEEAKTEREKRSAVVAIAVAEGDLKVAQAKKALSEATTDEETRAAKTDLLKAKADQARNSAKMSNFKAATKSFDSATSALDTTTGMLSTIDKIQKLINAPGITGGTVLDRITGPVASRAPSVTDQARDIDALLSQITAQSFLEKIPTMRGTGPISNTEGERLAAAAGNLTLNQSPKQFRETLAAMRSHAQKIQDEAQRTVAKYNEDYSDAGPTGARADSAASMSDDALRKALGL